MKRLNFRSKRPISDPHDLSSDQALRRVEICRNLLDNSTDDRFLKRIITVDEKCAFFVNPDMRKQWVPNSQPPRHVPKRNKFGRKVMLSVWWNYEGGLLFETIPEGRAVNSDIYCDQIARLYELLRQKYPGLINRKRALLQQDNAPPHCAL